MKLIAELVTIVENPNSSVEQFEEALKLANKEDIVLVSVTLFFIDKY
jgi:hypothetical protein